MKFTLSPIALIIPTILSLPEIVPAAAAAAPSPIDNPSIEARSPQFGKIAAANAAYRSCAQTSCHKLGTFNKDTVITVDCYTDGEAVNGDSRWGSGFHSGKPFCIPLAYVSMAGPPQPC